MGKTYDVTLLHGDGIGPEITESARKVVDATGVNIKWEVMEAGEDCLKRNGTVLPDNTLESIWRNGVALKGPMTVPFGGDFVNVSWPGGPFGHLGLRTYPSVGNAMRRDLDCFVKVSRIKTLTDQPLGKINLIIVREITEDVYAGKEFSLGEGVTVGLKVITRTASEKAIRYAFNLARQENRQKVTVVHKANVMKKTDAFFLDIAKEIASEFDDVKFDDRLADAMCTDLIRRPGDHDVLVMANLYGDILSDLTAAIAGGLSIGSGVNVGEKVSIFEAIHGSAPKYGGLDRANPTGLIMSSAVMLSHLGETKASQAIDVAIEQIYQEGGNKLTVDMGGEATTSKFTDYLIDILKDHLQ